MPMMASATSQAITPQLTPIRRRRAMLDLPSTAPAVTSSRWAERSRQEMHSARSPATLPHPPTPMVSFRILVRCQTLDRKNRSLGRLPSLLLQHELALFLDQGFGFLGDRGEQPWQLDRNADMVVRHVDGAVGGLSQHGNAQVEVIARPVFLEHRELGAERTTRAFQSRLQAADRFLPSQAMRDGYDNRLRHRHLHEGRASCRMPGALAKELQDYRCSSAVRTRVTVSAGVRETCSTRFATSSPLSGSTSIFSFSASAR